MKLTISVTQEDIDNGEPEEPDACPIALSVERLVGANNWIGVTDVDLCIWSPKLEMQPYTQPLPRSAQKFVTRFDGGKAVKPFRFRAVIPDELLTPQ